MKKRLSVFLLAMVMILSVCPCISVSAATTSDVVIYDAYISGNFVVGETLTANYSVYPENCETLDTTNTEATITWYALNRTSSKVLLQEGGTTYKIPNNYYPITETDPDTGESTTIDTGIIAKNGTHYGIFFTITPKDKENADLGNVTYSHFGTSVVSKSESATTTDALNASIVPKNPEGSMRVGDKLVARYNYRDPSGETEVGTTFQWYTADTMNGEQTPIEGATSIEYTIQPADVGKWFYVTITPKNAKRSGTAVTTRNHYGNAFYSPDATLGDNNVYGSYNSTKTYNSVKILADGNRVASSNNRLPSGIWVITSSSASLTNKYINIDAGKVVPFDGFYFRHGSGNSQAKVPNFVAKYSDGDTDENGDMIWHTAVDTVEAKDYDDYEFPLDKVTYARYFRMEINSISEVVDETTGETIQNEEKVSGSLGIDEFYPFLTNDAVISIDDNVAELGLSANGENELLVSAYGTPKSALLEEFELASEMGADITSKYVNSKSEEITTDFVVDENLTNTYLTFTGAKGIPTTLEIKYRGDIVNDATLVPLSGAVTLVNDKSFAGGENGYMRLAYKVYVPEGCSPRINYYTGGTGYSSSAAFQVPQQFDDATKLIFFNKSGDTNYGYKTKHMYEANKWHDVEVIFDYSSVVLPDTGLATINTYMWVDGQFVGKNKRGFNRVKPFTAEHAHATLSSDVYVNETTQESVQVKDVTFREMYEIKSLVTPPEYTLSLMDDTTAVEKIDVNKAYTMAEDLSVYHVDTVNYLATYDVTYDEDGAEIKRQLVALDGAVKADGEVAAVSLGDSISTENADGTVTKKEVRAFSFAPDMVANAKAGVWKAAE